MAKSQPEGQKVGSKASVKKSKVPNAKHDPPQKMKNDSWKVSQHD